MGQRVFVCKGCWSIQEYRGSRLCVWCENEKEGAVVEGSGPAIFVRGGRGDPGDLDYDPAYLGGNVAHGHRTPEEQERVYREVYKEEQEQAAEVAKLRKGTRRSDCEWRKIATVPREAFEAEKHVQDNKQAWQDGGRELLKKTGWLYSHED